MKVDGGQRLSLVTARPIVEIAGLSKKFKEVQALNDISMEIPKGKIIGLLGPNGSGKTTLLKILAGMYASYEGSVLINGERPSHVTKAEVAYLPDKNSFAKEMSVADVLKIYEVFFEDFNPEKCGELLERFHVGRESKIGQMSKGVIDKLQICLVMSRSAKLYLLDEPIGGVDVSARDYVLDTILENFHQDSTIIVATHLVCQIERLFDSAIILEKGVLAAFRDCDELRDESGLPLEGTLKRMFGEGCYGA